MGLQDERVLVEDDYAENYSDFVTLVEANHGYPATSLQWQPAAATSFAWSQKVGASELLATTGDALRVWEYASDQQPAMSNYVGRQPSGGGHRLTLRAALSGVCPLSHFAHLGPLQNELLCRDSTIDCLFTAKQSSKSFDRSAID